MKHRRNKIWNQTDLINMMVRMKGLEPSRLAALAPKASVSTNSTTRASNSIITETDWIVISEAACAIIESKTYQRGREYE